MESAELANKSEFLAEGEGSSDEMGSTSDQRPLPQIEAKVCDNKVLLRLHCENQRGVLIKILSQVEKLNLAVSNTNVSQFGKNRALDITIIAEMEKEFNLTIKELVRNLQSALQLVN
ncbi:transcription factor bHLH25-like [Coffea arabica]|uniref:Transcription factor bHLH25-like n=1 Tax=Coffea arabica TaxID=13443 RepID=A0A6P6VX94_COFAR|nr:transcription factor bHLH25-like [Coffea arabica]